MSFSFIQITDHHITESDAEFLRGFSTRHAFRTVLKHIAQNPEAKIDFILSTGDIVENPTEASYQSFLQMINATDESAEAPGPLHISAEGLTEMPLYLLPGNHDDREYFFKSFFPGTPATPLMNKAFIYKGVQCICLDMGPNSKAITHPQTLDFLAQCLKAELPSIIFMHHHLVEIGSRWLDSFIPDETGKFWEIVTGQNVLGIFCGHVHTTYEQKVNNIPVFGLRSTAPQFVLQDEPLACLLPPHYRLVTFQDGVLTTKLFEVPL
ncbi:3',5'-cyclic-AMP phosphodiesterase [Chloroflexota bacterium]